MQRLAPESNFRIDVPEYITRLSFTILEIEKQPAGESKAGLDLIAKYGANPSISGTFDFQVSTQKALVRDGSTSGLQTGTYYLSPILFQVAGCGPVSIRSEITIGFQQGAATMGFALSSGGAGVLSTSGTIEPSMVGYATATIDTGTVPYGVAVFSFRQNDAVVSEAAVPPSPPTTSARIFVDYRSATMASPKDAGPIDINTGLAVVNRGSVPANLTYTLRNKAGGVLTAGHGKVSRGAHFAKFIQELRDVAPDINIPGDFSSATQFGSLDISSDQPLSVLGLRLTTNQRNESLLTTTPIVDLTKASSNQPLYFPQFVDGGGYITNLMLMNASNAIETGRLAFFNDNGSPLIVNQAGGARDSVFSYAIQPDGVFVFQTDGSPANANIGSVQVTPDAKMSSPVGAGVFSFSQGGIRVTESGIPAAIPTTHARIYIDQSGNHATGLAIANPGSSAISVILKAFQTDGTTPAGSSLGPVNLKSNGHMAKFVSELVSGLPSDFKGVLDIVSTSPFAALTLRALTNSRRDFLLTAFPTADAIQTAPAPIIFPQIVDGGGYMTEFILLSSGAGCFATLRFFGDDGAPIVIGK